MRCRVMLTSTGARGPTPLLTPTGLNAQRIGVSLYGNLAALVRGGADSFAAISHPPAATDVEQLVDRYVAARSRTLTVDALHALQEVKSYYVGLRTALREQQAPADASSAAHLFHLKAMAALAVVADHVYGSLPSDAPVVTRNASLIAASFATNAAGEQKARLVIGGKLLASH
jgi:hypothetical protein